MLHLVKFRKMDTQLTRKISDHNIIILFWPMTVFIGFCNTYKLQPIHFKLNKLIYVISQLSNDKLFIV